MSLGGHAWSAALHGYVQSAPPGLTLSELRSGDHLEVQTQHTCYRFVCAEGDWAELSTDRENRPSGRVRIQGCALGAGTSIAIDRLFVGGSLEYVSNGGELTHRTTPIVSLRLWQRR